MSEQPVLPPNKIAFIIDGEVLDVFHTDDRLAAILLSNPTIVNATAEYANLAEGFNLIGYKYDGQSFTAPVILEPQDGLVPLEERMAIGEQVPVPEELQNNA